MAAELTMFVSKQKGWNIIVLVLTSLFLSLRNQTKTQPYPNSHFGPDNKPAAVNNPRAHYSEPSSLRGSAVSCGASVGARCLLTGQFPIFLMT